MAGRLAETLGVNLTGTANVTWCAVQHMIAGGGGTIVNVSSRGAFRGEPGQPAYGASKAGLERARPVARASRSRRTTSRRPVRAWLRGRPTWPPRTCKAHAGTQIRAQSPFGRVARPEEIAAAVLYLASPEATWASGSILDLNGASYLRT